MGDIPDVQPTEPVSVSEQPSGVTAGPAGAGKVVVVKQEKEVNDGSTPASAIATLMGTGRRKESVARVRLIAGPGTIRVNQRPYDTYFPRETLRLAIRSPLLLTRQLGKFDVIASVKGGGTTGQAGAVQLGIARALARLDDAHRVSLRAAGLLTRDSRMKERKKYGQKGARKRFQWTKR